MMLVCELLIVLVLALVGLLGWSLRPRWFLTSALQGLDRLAQQRGRAVLTVFLVNLVLSGTASWLRWPVPHVHDEFSYLLAADTFAHGRLTNPTPPLSRHFESFHIVVEPSYQSKYPPAQAMVLAVGQRLAGDPVVGLWLGLALACASLTWMLQAWLPPRWALYGGLLAALHGGLLRHWGQTFWGGAVPMIGGCLVYGAVRRLVARPRVADAIWLAVGLTVLANSRPFEGLVASLPAAGILLASWISPHRPRLADIGLKIVLPWSLAMALAAGAMLFYNQQVTGHALRMPYLEYEAQYGGSPLFLWQKMPPQPQYRHQVFADFYLRGWASRVYESQQSWSGLIDSSRQKLVILWGVFIRPLGTVLLLALPWVLARRWPRVAAGILLWTVLVVLSAVFLSAQYLAPAVGLLAYLGVECLRQLHAVRRGKVRIGRTLVRIWTAGWVGLVAVFLLQQTWLTSQNDQAHLRAKIEQGLSSQPGEHLVLVRYSQKHDPIFDWVYNRADLAQAKVVWARFMSPEENRELVQHFSRRRLWIVEPDARLPDIRPYRLETETDKAIDDHTQSPAKTQPGTAQEAPR